MSKKGNGSKPPSPPPKPPAKPGSNSGAKKGTTGSAGGMPTKPGGKDGS